MLPDARGTRQVRTRHHIGTEHVVQDERGHLGVLVAYVANGSKDLGVDGLLHAGRLLAGDLLQEGLDLGRHDENDTRAVEITELARLVPKLARKTCQHRLRAVRVRSVRPRPLDDDERPEPLLPHGER